MISHTEFLGGAKYVSIGGSNRSIHPNEARLYTVVSTGGAIRLPDATKLRTGFPVFLVINAGAVALPLQKSDGSAAVTPDVPAGQACFVGLLSNATSAGEWSTQFKVADHA